MIDLTVKTLDSQNHAFSLNDDITVRQFKEHIADTVNIAADLQRLIYCGRVLQDDKLLSEYDVNGKVIHLVQRAPPSSSQRSHNSSQGHGGSGEWQSTPRVIYRHTQFHDDPMYIGSFSIPADVLEGYEWPAPQMNNSLANSHLTVVRRMLDQANNVIDRLDNPSAPASTGTTSTDNNSSLSTSSNCTQSTTANATESGSAWIANDATAEIRIPTSRCWSTDDDVDATAPTTETSEGNSDSPPQQQQQQQQERDDTTPRHSASASNQATPSESNDTTSTIETLVPRELAELLEMLLTTQDRLRPYIRERLLSSGAPAQRQLNHDENQRIIDGVTECFHFLSHAQHALSNLNINMQQLPPRTLRCRPMVIQPSAILQAGLPIQVEAHISLHGQNENNADGDDSGTTTPRPSTGSTQTTASSGTETPVSTAPNPPHQFQQQQSTPEIYRRLPRQGQTQVQTAFGTVINFPNNVEVVMESAPQPPRVWSFSTGDNQGSSNNNNNNNVTNNNNGNSTPAPNSGTTGGGGSGGGGGGGGSFPWGAAPSPDIIRNLMQAVAGYMAQTSVGHTPAATTTSSTASNPSSNATPMGCPRHRTPAASSESTANSGQNSQTRGNTETHPTTSTQTRTTSRTHVFHQHAQALGVGVGLAQSLDFDPFLPCNSHHIRRGNSTLSSSSSSSSSTAAAPGATTNIAASTQTGGQNNASTGTHASTQARTTISSTHPRVPAMRGDLVVYDDTPLAECIAITESISAHSHRGGIPFSHIFSTGETGLLVDFNSRSSGLIGVIFSVLGTIPVHLWCRLVRGDLTPLTDTLIQTLRTRIRDFTGENSSSSYIPLAISELLSEELKHGLEHSLNNEITNDRNGETIDIFATVNTMLQAFIVKLGKAIYSDEIVVANIVKIIQDFGRDLSSVLRYSLRDGQSGLERVIARFANRMTRGTHETFRQWIMGPVAEWFIVYTRQVARIDVSEFLELLKYKPEILATTSSDILCARAESPMDVDNETNSHAMPADDSWMYEDDIPTATFPGHENLLPDWIPIVERDGVTQRRQLSLSDDDVTTMSDAYLSTMPSKRRKLVEQRKAPLLVSPSSNRSAIPSSMERLMRESVGRAGFEEVDGAVAAIVADPTVRRAFGQAIRESLTLRRYQTPDFPDAHRFPNATKFFTNSNRPAEQ